MPERPEFPAVPEEVPDEVSRAVPAGHEDGAGPEPDDPSRGLPPSRLGLRFDARQVARLVEVRCCEQAERQDLGREGRHAGRREQASSARRADDGIDHDASRPVTT
jgi:hypothetical protein